ncbi:putative bifunctional diguanylate cyclase/phosphodiesterase [Devosia lucknowensis]|uniref:putative bifunctional diguanylate cyclase/phosphodiesterase n=1 Tax=Devosia lucknowensis TaxID=1096929 RepID=UPI0014820A12|nr:EAL domain-containing protein [Devosia lucknowensis]
MSAASAAKSLLDTAQYSGRFVLAYRWVACAVGMLSLCWSIFFAFHGDYLLSASQAGVAAVAALSVALANRGQLATALLITQAAFLFFILALCLVFDVPSADVPRVSHIFLLVLAMVGYLNFKRQPSRMQMGLLIASVASFVIIASSNVTLPFTLPIPDDIRLYGAWLNAGFATLMLVACVYIFQLELERSDRHEVELKSALWNRQFELFYQPQVNRDGVLIGAETLIRWKHPSCGYVSPGEFIPQAEDAGLMSEIGQWVLETALQTLQEWRNDPRRRHLTLSVNVSASQFLDEDFEQVVVQLLDRYPIDPTLLKLEITESVMVTNTDLVAAKMQILRGIGIGLALDDFGTGYSSLAYIRGLPLTELKIDRSFVKDVTESGRSAALARSIVQLGRDLDLTVLAEGVETPEQFAFLRDCGCQEFQGFYFGRPVPLQDFEATGDRQAA